MAQFHFLIFSPCLIRMHIAGTFRSSLSPTLQDISMKSVYMWRMGLLGLVTRAILQTHLRPPRRSCCGRSDVCQVTSSPRCQRGGRGQAWRHGSQGSWVGSTEEGIHEGSHHKGPPLPPRRCSSWRGRCFGRGWRVTVVLWEHGGVRSVVTVVVFSITTTKRAGVSKR